MQTPRHWFGSGYAVFLSIEITVRFGGFHFGDLIWLRSRDDLSCVGVPAHNATIPHDVRIHWFCWLRPVHLPVLDSPRLRSMLIRCERSSSHGVSSIKPQFCSRILSAVSFKHTRWPWRAPVSLPVLDS